MSQWVVMRVQPLTIEAHEAQSGLAVIAKVDWGKMVGLLPVYATKEDALAEYPDGPVAEIWLVEV